jgi:hypothetical protein
VSLTSVHSCYKQPMRRVLAVTAVGRDWWLALHAQGKWGIAQNVCR